MNKKRISHTYNHTLYLLQLSQCRVGAQSLGKRTRSLGANVIASDTGSGGWEGVSTILGLAASNPSLSYSIYYYILSNL